MRGGSAFRRPARSSAWSVRASIARRRGFTLVELLIILAVLALLAGILVPSLSAAKALARLAACAVQMRGIGGGLRVYAAVHDNRLPPFAFSNHGGEDGKDANLPLSGHWGGKSQGGDPDCFGRRGVRNVNLWALVAERMATPKQLVCPGARTPWEAGTASYFPYTSKFSTYCLRMPYSEDLFRRVPELLGWSGRGLLGIYTAAGSGVRFHVGMHLVTVPYVRTDISYREADPATALTRQADPTSGAILTDTFWYQRQRPAPQDVPGLKTYEVRAGWCHGRKFNVLFGDGAVHALRDDGTVAANSVAPGAMLPNDGAQFASYAIKVWRYFEDKR